jgi:hypothetical membrane protein
VLIYPGGTFRNHNTEGYTFSQNFLSDLGRTVAFNGDENYFGAILYIIGLSFAGIMTIMMFVKLPEIFSQDKWTKRCLLLSRILGVMAGISLIGIACIPNNLFDIPHTIFVNIAFVKLLQSLTLLMFCIYRTAQFPNKYGYILLFSNSVLLGFILLKILGPSIHTSDIGLVYQAISQKIMVAALLVSLSFLSLGTKRIWNETNQ